MSKSKSKAAAKSSAAGKGIKTKTKFDFQGKRILVTGTGGGIGGYLVEQLLASNAKVIALSRTKSKLDQLKQKHPEVDIVCVDAADGEALRKAVEAIEGPIDGLANCAGQAIMYDCIKDDFDPQKVAKLFAINTTAPMILSQVVARKLIKRGVPGTIVNISSLGSLRAFRDHILYGASKAALDYVTKTMAMEYGPHQVRVNAINPTVVQTDLALAAGWGDPKKANQLKSKLPLAKFCEKEDVTNLMMYLLSDQSDMITGALVPIDGGYSCGPVDRPPNP